MPSLLLLANKRYHTDFRKYLMRAAERAGARALHIYCWEQIILARNGSELAMFPTNADEHDVLQLVQENLGDDRLIVLTGLGGHEASLATRLQRVLENAVLVYDVFDDLLFNASGVNRAVRMLQDAIWRCRCTHTIVLDAALKSRYPRAYHIDNASHLQPIAAVEKANPRSLVYIGSIDSRVDFAWLDALSSQGVQLAIYGRIHETAPQAAADLDRLLKRRLNVSFRGGYDNDDLWSILANFRAGVLPYHVDHPMTRHVNPDKLYHYLNAGLEVLAAPIPQALRHAAHIHLVTADGAWREALEAIVSAPRRGEWSAATYSWDQRWAELVQAVAA
jgi:hypothetical protein